MCEPTSIAIGAAVLGAGLSMYGQSQAAGAARSSANATREANQRMQIAQNDAFTQRMGAARRQTDAQSDVMNQTMTDRYAAAGQMRQQQQSAMDAAQETLARENATAQSLREQGDRKAQELIAQTSAEEQAKAEAQRAQRQNLLLDQNMPDIGGPSNVSPTDETGKALARRGAEAATNVRAYGAKVAATAAHGQPLLEIGNAIANNKFGIMPAEVADRLLRSGADTRMLPNQIAFRNATSEGGAMDELIRSRGQAGLDTAGLEYGNTMTGANLRQSNENVLAQNAADQAKADAAYKQQLAGIWGQLGQLATYGAGYYGGGFGKTPGAGFAGQDIGFGPGRVSP